MTAPDTPPRFPPGAPDRDCRGELMSCAAILLIAGIVTLTAVVAVLYLWR